MRLPPICAAAMLAAFLASIAPACADEELPLLLSEDFEQGMDRWETTDPSDRRANEYSVPALTIGVAPLTGVTLLEAADAAPVPALLLAFTVKV